MYEGTSLPSHDNQHIQPSTPNYLSPNSSGYVQSNSASPTVDDTNTPAESISTLSVHYQSSVYSDIDDPFYGVDFGTLDGASPSFLASSEPVDFAADQSFTPPDQTSEDAHSGIYQPISPDYTPSRNTVSPAAEHEGLRSNITEQFPPPSVSPQELSKPFSRPAVPFQINNQSAYTLTPSTGGSGQSSEDGLAVAVTPVMPAQSPHVTISVWGNDNQDAVPVVPAGDLRSLSDKVDTVSNAAATSSVRDAEGRWLRDENTGQGGLDPENRLSKEVQSINEIATEREEKEKDEEVREHVNHWLRESSSQAHDSVEAIEERSVHSTEDYDNISPREIPMGHMTENKALPGQTYFLERGGEVTTEDINIMRQNRNFADAPMLPNIHKPENKDGGYQAQTSQQAMEKFQQMYRDTDSVLSRAATWGTRRRSFPPGLDADYEDSLSGNFLRKMNINKDETRRPSIFSRAVRGLVKKQSNSSKRSRSSIPEEESAESPGSRRESRDSLAPPTRTPSGGLGGLGGLSRRQAVPSINTAFVSVGASVAAIGSTTHARSGSITATPTVLSPRSPNTLSVVGVKNMLRRPRSGSELAGMWEKSGGPPVARLAKTTSAPPVQAPVPVPEPEEDEEDEDELYDNPEEKHEANKYAADMDPTPAGFKDHILKLNPMLRETNEYLVERIAYHQVARYKNLLNARIKHLNITASKQCGCGSMCIAQGGRANPLDTKGDSRQDPLSASGRYDVSDGDLTPLEGAINQESFPQDIPVPPTSTLPAEFECQLCFQAKKFHKPSDWTKHVHEDVQPFTCTWDRCREPKTFKRKADWVRHENEGHRHLEWWTCDVDDCRHTCYRRDNFLQHLVREHKFAEPKIKTKAAIKRAGGLDPTWQKVEKCHIETHVKPQDEACKFCAKTFPSWKKLTVHLAKHMEQISLPVLRLVARKELEADTIISPIQDPPPRSFPALPPDNVKREHIPYNGSAGVSHTPMLGHQGPHAMGYPNHQHHGFFPVLPSQMPEPQMPTQPQYPPTFYNHTSHQYNNIGQALEAPINLPVNHGFNDAQGYGNMPVTTGSYMARHNPYVSVAPDMEPFPAFAVGNPLGLQDMQGPAGGAPLPYNNMMDPSSVVGDPYTPHGSVSPYSHSHSPNQGQGQFYGR